MPGTQVENNEMTKEHFPDDDVRIVDDPKELESADPRQGHEVQLQTVLQNTHLSGGSDNTASPAGGNPTHHATLDSHQQVADSNAAQKDGQNKTASPSGKTSE